MSARATAAERRLRWLVSALDDPSELTVDDIESTYDMSGWRGGWSYERELEVLHHGRHSSSRPLTIEWLEPGGDGEVTAVLHGGDGKRWSVTCWVEDGEPHRITRARLVPTPPDGLLIRLANPKDGPALAELERRAPLRLGKDPLTFMTFDHGDDYFAPSRLMEEATVYVAEVEGRLVGVYCGTMQPVHADGEAKRLFLEHHVRIDPEASRGAIFWALCDFGRDRYARDADSIAFYVSPDNLALRKFVVDVPPWSVPPVRALLPCRPNRAGEDVGRMATAADADEVTRVLNGCHAASALFVPYSPASLDARLTRDPDQYGWGDLRLAGGAAVGVGRQLTTVTKERGGEVRATRRAVAIDHGFLPGRDDDYRALLQSWCARLGRLGATHLVVFTSERSPTYDIVTNLADELEPFDFWAFDIPEPQALATGGFYVDPVYF